MTVTKDVRTPARGRRRHAVTHDHGAGPQPTEGEEHAADRFIAEQDPADAERVAEHYEEMRKIGADVKGEGKIESSGSGDRRADSEGTPPSVRTDGGGPGDPTGTGMGSVQLRGVRPVHPTGGRRRPDGLEIEVVGQEADLAGRLLSSGRPWRRASGGGRRVRHRPATVPPSGGRAGRRRGARTTAGAGGRSA